MRQASFRFVCAARIALVAAIALASCGEVRAQQTPAAAGLKAVLQRDLDAYLRTRGSTEHLSSLSLTIRLAKDRSPITVTSGTTRYHGGTAVTPKNLYQIGSNTKAFTAVAVLQLEAEHRLSIDAPIGDYLPQYRAYRQLTLRRLLSMSGGLESYDNTPAWERSFARDPMANVSADTLIRLVYPSIKFPPGTKYYYSNTGYLLAQEVVDARSKSGSFSKEIARVIASAHLHDTFYTSDTYAPAIAGRVVAGYYENDDAGLKRFLGRDMSGYSLSWAQGAGSIVSTPADLAIWARALYTGTQLLPAKQQRELTSLISVKTARPLRVPTAKDPAGFGLGVVERLDPKLGLFWFYQGETLGFRAAQLYFPKSGLIVCLFANSRPTESNSKMPELFATLYAHIQASN